MATKQIIVLSQQSDGFNVSYQVAFWFPVTLNPTPKSSGSVWSASGTSVGASAPENTAIQNGSIVEEVRGFGPYPVGTPTSALQAILQQYWVKRNAQIAGQGANQFYGTFFDGSVWSAV